MEKLLKNYRIPIISFCLGILFSSICIWGYITFYGNNSEIKKFEILKKETVVGTSTQNRRIYIAGAVNKEGSFEIQENEDIFNFIENNVGLHDDADIESFRKLIENSSNDSFFIYVPSVCGSDLIDLDVADVQSGQKNRKLSINYASKSELESLPGIGDAYAERIIQGRPYSQLNDLKKVKGIGDKTYSKLEPYICL